MILSAIEKYIGPPSAGKHWNTWKDEGATGKKHKGSAISDIEKARRDPACVHMHKCVPGRMRPSRPVRRAPELASHVPLPISTHMAVPASAAHHRAIESAVAAAPTQADAEADIEPEAGPISEPATAADPSGGDVFRCARDALDGLQDEASLLKTCNELQLQVEQARATKAKQAADVKAAKKQAKEAAKKQAKEVAKEPDATAKKAPDGAKPLHESSAGKSNTKKRKAEDKPDEEVSYPES